MSEINPEPSPAEIQKARAAYLREILHPWSIRKLAARTGLSKAIVESRLNGSQVLTIDDLRVIAPVAHKSPEALLSELLAVDPRHRDYNVGTSEPPTEHTAVILPLANKLAARAQRPGRPSTLSANPTLPKVPLLGRRPVERGFYYRESQ